MAIMEPCAKAGSACRTGLFKDNILFNGLGRAHGRGEVGFGIAHYPRSIAVSGATRLRGLAACVVLAASIALAGCNSDEISLANNAKDNQPVPPKLVSDKIGRASCRERG